MPKLRSYFIRQKIMNPKEFHKFPNIINVCEDEKISREHAEISFNKVLKSMRLHGVSGDFSLCSRKSDGSEVVIKVVTAINHPFQQG